MRCLLCWIKRRIDIQMLLDISKDEFVCPMCGYSLVDTPTHSLSKDLEAVVLRIDK